MGKYFGTDGIRGIANGHIINVDLATKISQAAAIVLSSKNTSKAKAILAKDSRISGDFISAAVAAGLASAGVDVYFAGVLPTPAAAYLVNHEEADFGVMISASHNPAPDNGIKFLSKGGQKLDDSVENSIEEEMKKKNFHLPTGNLIGRIYNLANSENSYMLHLVQSLQGQRLDGLKIVLDCAHGASSKCLPKVFKLLGAKVIVIGNNPNGFNINDGYGTNHLEKIQKKVIEEKADIGIANDGDADRCIAIDHEGNIIDGDQIMMILAISMKNKGSLHKNTLVATVMSNLGLSLALRENGINIVQTKVGDRYVVEAMRSGQFSLGGEQSGHIIMSSYATTGDGILTGLHISAEMMRTNKTLKELASPMKHFPQVLLNVSNVNKDHLNTNKSVIEMKKNIEEKLNGKGRVVLRASGTEPLIRIMVEASSKESAHLYAEQLKKVIENCLHL